MIITMAKNWHFSVILGPMSLTILNLIFSTNSKNVRCVKKLALKPFEKMRVEKPMSQIPYILAVIDDIFIGTFLFCQDSWNNIIKHGFYGQKTSKLSQNDF